MVCEGVWVRVWGVEECEGGVRECVGVRVSVWCVRE